MLPVDKRGGGGYAWDASHQQILPAFEAAQTWHATDTPLVVLAGERYGAGSSRDWAAKAQALMGVKAVIANSFERIHRTNLIGMGILPLHFIADEADKLPEMDGTEILDITGLGMIAPGATPLKLYIRHGGRQIAELNLEAVIDSQQELRYLRYGGILPFVIQQTLKE